MLLAVTPTVVKVSRERRGRHYPATFALVPPLEASFRGSIVYYSYKTDLKQWRFPAMGDFWGVAGEVGKDNGIWGVGLDYGE